MTQPREGTWSERIAAAHAGSTRTALVEPGGRELTGAELLGKAVAAAHLLVDLRVSAGTPVPALLTTSADSLALLLGGAAVDRPLAPLGPRLTAAELAGPVRGTGSPVLITEPQWMETALLVAEATGTQVVELPDLPRSAGALPVPRGDVGLLLHTSGTTGAPKPVPLTQDVLEARARLTPSLLGLGPDSRWASGSPLHHIGGVGNTLVALSAGAAVLPTPAFSRDWWRGLAAQGATHCMIVPSMIEMLLADGVLAEAGVRTLVYGASPIRVETLRRVLDILPGARLVQLFGQTEGSPITVLTPEDHHRAAAGASHLLATVGRAVPGLRLRIDEPDGADVGEVLAAASHLQGQGADGWLHTGDLGFLDAQGYLNLVGRRGDMIVRGGENVYPVEVEDVLAGHPAVAAAGVIGVPDDRLGETLAAFVVPVSTLQSPDHTELRRYVRDRLAGFKVPTYWHEVDALPTNSAGKLVRGPLRELHRETVAGSGKA